MATSAANVVHSDPGILGGTPVFVGTRVPVQILFDCIEGGDTLDRFLDQFPTVRREQAIAALALARDLMHEVCVRQAVERGTADADAGRIASQGEAMARLGLDAGGTS